MSWDFDYLGTSKSATITGTTITIELPTTEFIAQQPVLPVGATLTPDYTTITIGVKIKNSF